jgi:hypothetical protein
MKIKLSFLGVLLITAIGFQSAFASGNYECNNLNLVSGQYFVGSTYNVVVGVDFETQVTDAMLFSRVVAPGGSVNEVTLVSQDGEENATNFSNGTSSFSVSTDKNSGTLSLDNGKVVLLCSQKPINGAVTGSN